MLDENLETVTRRVADLELQIWEKDTLIETLKNWVLNQKKELDNIQADMQIWNLELEEAQMEKLREARAEARELREKLKEGGSGYEKQMEKMK